MNSGFDNRSTLKLTDKSGAIAYTDSVVVQNGSSTSCLASASAAYVPSSSDHYRLHKPLAIFPHPVYVLTYLAVPPVPPS